MTTPQTITTDAQTLLNTVNTLLPVIEALVPQAKQNDATIKLITSAAGALIPLINLIPTGADVTVAQQAAQYARVYTILAGDALNGPEWQKQS